MTLGEKLTAREIIGTMKDMSARPEFYSGRGATGSDLDNRRLERIHQLIEREHGGEAAQNYVQMVADIPVLSATDFLLNLYRLDASGWEWNKGLLGNEKGVDVGPDTGNGTREAIGFATIGAVLGGMSDRNETPYIREEFLRNHGIETGQCSLFYEFEH